MVFCPMLKKVLFVSVFSVWSLSAMADDVKISINCDEWIGDTQVFANEAETKHLVQWLKSLRESCTHNANYPEKVSVEQACALKEVDPLEKQIQTNPAVSC